MTTLNHAISGGIYMFNRIHPELRQAVQYAKGLNLQQYRLIRASMAQVYPTKFDSSLEVLDREIQTNTHSIQIRIYKRKEQTTLLPGLLWIHGGGYVFGSHTEDDLLCQRFVLESHCVVVSVNYRLAPEHPYPAALEDCYSALQWMSEHHSEIQMDVTKIGIAGASAGGGLTAALALLTKDRQGPKLIFQMPLYPMINDRNDHFSNKEITANLPWNYALNETAWSMYLGNNKNSDQLPIYAAVTRASIEELKGLPRTYTCVGQLDPLRDETLAYVTKLAQAGVDVTFHLYAGAYHIFERLNPKTAIGQHAMNEYIEAVASGLHYTNE